MEFENIKQLKEFLNQGYKMQKYIKTLENEIERWETKMTKVTTSFSDRVQTSVNLQPIVEPLCKVIELKDELIKTLNDQVEKILEIKRLIDLVDDTDYKNLLTLRYISFKKWEQIAVDMNYNWRTVFKIHDRVLDDIFKLGSQGQ